MLKCSNAQKALFVFFVLGPLLYLADTDWRRNQVIKYDTVGYYNYLPATLMYQDLYQLEYYDRIDTVYYPTGDYFRYALRIHPETGNTVIKYTCGVSILQLPGFLIAHFLSSVLVNYESDGYDLLYQLFVHLNNIIFVCWGLYLLLLFLRTRFSFFVSISVGLIILFGSNLFFYTSFNPGMSHGYLFFLYSSVLFLTERWYRERSLTFSILLGLVLGMITLIRPTDVVVSLIPLLWFTHDFSERLKIWNENALKILAIVLSAAFVLSIQLIYWKLMTDSWIYYSYQHEGFNWTDPKIIQGLFSYKKGWFIYTPLAFVGILTAIAMLFTKLKSYSLMIGAIYIPLIYVVFCWSNWYYGGSFGCRVMIQTLALLAYPLAFLLEWLIGSKSKTLLVVVFSFIGILVALNLFQTWQYDKGIIHWEAMDKEKYWKVFGKLSKPSGIYD